MLFQLNYLQILYQLEEREKNIIREWLYGKGTHILAEVSKTIVKTMIFYLIYQFVSVFLHINFFKYIH